LVTLTLSEAVVGSHSCSFTLDGEKHLGIAASRFIPWVKLHWRVESAQHYYKDSSLDLQRVFFDHFLLGKSTSISDWPKVRYEIRDAYYKGREHSAHEWPIENTDYQSLYLGGSGLFVQPQPAATRAYSPIKGELLTFDHVFTADTDLVGHMALKLWVEIETGEDMDIFVAIQKLDQQGKVVPFAFYAQYEDGPVALGWLRASHRELCENTTDYQPVQAHKHALPLTPGVPVEVDIEIWPSGTRFAQGEGVRLVIGGKDIYDYPQPGVYARHQDLTNKGRQKIWVGADRPSRLLIPVIRPGPVTKPFDD